MPRDRPVLVPTRDVWAVARRTRPPTGETLACRRGDGWGADPDAGHPLLVTRARGGAGGALSCPAAAGLRLGLGSSAAGRQPAGAVVTRVTGAGPSTPSSPRPAGGGVPTLVLDGILRRPPAHGRRPDAWLGSCRQGPPRRSRPTHELMADDADPIHPPASTARSCAGSSPTAVVIGDGGDFVSFAGASVSRAARMLDGTGSVRLPGRARYAMGAAWRGRPRIA